MKKNVFEKESKVLAQSQEIAADATQNVGIDEYRTLLENFEELLGEAKVITNISDRLQNKLNVTNESLQIKTQEVQEANKALEAKNLQLQTTIDELTKAKADKKALAVIFTLAVVLFVLSEVVIDPFVESFIDQYISLKNSNLYLLAILIAKGGIALLLGPIDRLVRSYMLKKAFENAKRLKPSITEVY